jgi:tetratricopeptide (TPR) repeat protein
VYLGELGRGPQQDVRAVGPAINLAARLQQKAQPGQILVGESVYRQTHRSFAFARGEVEAKGFAGPVAAYEVLRALPRPEKVRGIEGLRADLIGREKELAGLSDALAAVRAGRGQIVTLIGEAGVGKSRLVAELKELALAPVADQPLPLWLEGRCLDVGMAVSYWPFLDLLRAHFAFLPEDDDRARGARVSAAVDALVGRGDLPLGRAEEMLPLLGHLLGARFGSDLDERLAHASPEQIKHQTFLILVDLLVALARPQPLILVLEDLHWADSLSLDLVSLLMESLRLAPLLLVCVYRPEQEHKCWHLGAIATRKCPERFTELHLRELTAAQSRRLVESLLHIEALPVSVKEQILGRAQGNPFFVEEVVRSLIDAGLVYHDGTVWRARAEIAEVAVPESIQGVILSRVDRLEAEAKHVLQSAAVIGRLFRRRLLEHLAQQEVELDRALAELEDRQLIYEERAIPEEEYSFHHVLAQETVYHNILRRRRAVFHRQVAEAMERLYADSLEEYFEQLAYHYEQAGVQEKALEYLERAGDKAQAQYANAVAEGYYRDLVERLDGRGRSQDAARVRLKLGTVLTRQARYETALKVLERTANIYDKAGDLESLARVTAAIGEVHVRRGTPEEAVGRLLSLLERLDTDSPSPGLAALYLALAHLHYFSEQRSQSLVAAERASALASALGDDLILAQAEALRGDALTYLGRVEEALCALERATSLAEATGQVYALCQSLNMTARVYEFLGEFGRGRSYTDRAMAVAERAGEQHWIAFFHFHHGFIAFYAGEWALARRYGEQADVLFSHIGASVNSGYGLLILGLVSYGEGQWQAATTALEQTVRLQASTDFHEALRIAQSVLAEIEIRREQPAAARDRLLLLLNKPDLEGSDVAFLLPKLAWAHLELGELAAAGRMADEAEAYAHAKSDRLNLVEALRVQALVTMRQGQWTKAEHALEEGLTLARRMPYPYAEGRLLHVYGDLHVQKGEPEPARVRLEAALAIFRRLGARKDVERVEQALVAIV